MLAIWIFLAVAAVVILLWILSRKPNQSQSSLTREVVSTKLRPQVVNAAQTPGLSGQGIILENGPKLQDQFQNRLFNTFLLADATPEVRKELLTGLKVARLQGIEVPEEFDARKKWPDAISIPMEQGTCGSCWAFASATAIADRFRIADPNNKELRTLIDYTPYASRNITYSILNNLDPYELVYCDLCGLSREEFPNTTEYLAGGSGECDHACEGGYITHVYRYIKESGISAILCNKPSCNPSAGDCPCNRTPTNCGTYDCVEANGKYDCRCINNSKDPRDTKCQSLSVVAPIAPIQPQAKKVYKPKDVYAVVSPNDPPDIRKQKVQEDVFQYGPVTVGFNVYQSFYDFFTKNPDGVYTRQQGGIAGDRKLGGHAVDIIGWGTKPVFHWLVRNSWSPTWAGDGYFKIQYDFGGILGQVMAAEI